MRDEKTIDEMFGRLAEYLFGDDEPTEDGGGLELLASDIDEYIEIEDVIEGMVE